MDPIVFAVLSTDMQFVHVLKCVLVRHQIVGLNVSLVLIADPIKHVLIKNAKIRALECVVLMRIVKL